MTQFSLHHTVKTICVAMLLIELQSPMVSVGNTIRTEMFHAPVAQLVEHRAVTREVVSSTPAGPSLRVLK